MNDISARYLRVYRDDSGSKKATFMADNFKGNTEKWTRYQEAGNKSTNNVTLSATGVAVYPISDYLGVQWTLMLGNIAIPVRMKFPRN